MPISIIYRHLTSWHVSCYYICMSKLNKKAKQWRKDYDIKTIEDCANASEELLCGFLGSSYSITHADVNERAQTIVEAHDERIFYAINVNGKNHMWRTRAFSSYNTNN